jgi:hypothetical protein
MGSCLRRNDVGYCIFEFDIHDFGKGAARIGDPSEVNNFIPDTNARTRGRR